MLMEGTMTQARVRYGLFRKAKIGWLPADTESGEHRRGWFILPARCDEWSGPYPNPESAIKALELV